MNAADVANEARSDHARQTAAEAPPLAPEVRDRLRTLLNG